MKESNYWDQFFKSGSIQDYLNYRAETKETKAEEGSAVTGGSASFTGSYRAEAECRRQDGAGYAGPCAGDGDRFEGGTHRGV